MGKWLNCVTFFAYKSLQFLQNFTIMKQDDTKQKFKKKGKIMAVGKESLNRAAKAMQNKPSGIEFKEKETKPMRELVQGLTEIVEEIDREEQEYKKEMVQFIDGAIKEKELEKPHGENLVSNVKNEESTTRVEKAIKVQKKNDKALIIDDKKIIKAAEKKKTKPVLKEGNIIIGTTIKKQNEKTKPTKQIIIADANMMKKETAETQHVTEKNKVTLRTTIVSIGDEMPNYFL